MPASKQAAAIIDHRLAQAWCRSGGAKITSAGC